MKLISPPLFSRYMNLFLALFCGLSTSCTDIVQVRGTPGTHIIETSTGLNAFHVPCASPASISPTGFAAGTGTVSDPYSIVNAAQLSNVRNFPNASFRLESDIDLDCLTFDPIKNFRGTFEGNGKTIGHWRYEDTTKDGVGFFVNLANGARVSNLTFVNATLRGRDNVGIVAASAMGDVSLDNIRVTGSVRGYNTVGGVIGQTSGSSSTRVKLNRIQTWIDVTGVINVGGVVGFSGFLVDFSKISVHGVINVHGAAGGGILGQLWGSVGITLNEIHVEAEIIGVAATRVGGVIGESNGKVNISNSLVTGSIFGGNMLGGIVGKSSGAFSADHSLVVGWIRQLGVRTPVGATCGTATPNPSYNSVYYAYDSLAPPWGTTQSSDCGGAATNLGQLELPDHSRYIGWDFSSVWKMDATRGYPVLQ